LAEINIVCIDDSGESYYTLGMGDLR